jgi:hypothetical protein
MAGDIMTRPLYFFAPSIMANFELLLLPLLLKNFLAESNIIGNCGQSSMAGPQHH